MKMVLGQNDTSVLVVPWVDCALEHSCCPRGVDAYLCILLALSHSRETIKSMHS